MKNKTFLSLTIFAISLLIIPQMTFASWWKPNTWKIFNRKAEVKTEQKIVATSTPDSRVARSEKATTTEKIEQKSEEAGKQKVASSLADTSAQKNDQSKKIEKLKKEVEALKQKQSQFKIIEKTTEKPIIAEKKESSSSQTKQNENIVTLPNGAVVEMDAKGKVARIIKEALQPAVHTYAPPSSSNSTNSSTSSAQKVSITLGSQTIYTTSAKIEWTTNEPTESKLYLSGGGISSKLFISETGYSTNHFSTINQLTPITDYSFKITVIGNAGFADVFGGFKTKTPSPIIKFDQSSHGISMGAKDKISWKSSYVESCTASGAWSGIKSTSGEEFVSFNQAGLFTYNLACTGLSGGTANATLTMTVFDSRPKIIFYFNDILSNTFSGKVGETVKLRWETSNTSGTNSCTASNSWSGSKYIGGSQDILLETTGESSYALTCVNGASGESGTNTATIIVTP